MRIGHISDLHLRRHLPGSSDVPARRSREAPRLMEKALRAMKDDGVEVVAVTGDLVDIPADSGREPLRAAVVDDYVLCRDLLSASDIPYIVVPGNHDDPAVMEEVFAAQTGVRDLGGLRFVSFWDREHEGHVPRRVDTELALLDQMSVDGRPQVHLQHFLVTPVPASDYPYAYDDRENLLNRIVGSKRVRLCLSGHYHPGTELMRVKNTFFSTVPALAEHPHRYRTYAVSEATVSMTEHCVRS